MLDDHLWTLCIFIILHIPFDLKSVKNWIKKSFKSNILPNIQYIKIQYSILIYIFIYKI